MKMTKQRGVLEADWMKWNLAAVMSSALIDGKDAATPIVLRVLQTEGAASTKALWWVCD